MRDLVVEMRAQGNEPSVVVPTPGLPTPWRLEQSDGTEVLRVRTLRAKDVGRGQRAVAEWLLPRLLLRGLYRSPLAQVNWQGIVWYSPTIFLGPMVRALKRRWRCRSYLILRDLFPDWAVDAGLLKKGVVYRYFKRVERRQYAAADVIGVQTAANVPLVRGDSPAEVDIEVLNNWLAEPVATPMPIDLDAGPLAGRVRFVYAGNMGAAQGMDGLIELAISMKSQPEAGFLFVGRGSEVPRLRRRVVEQALDNVQFIDELDSRHIPGLLAQCHVGLVALDVRHSTHNVPGKLLTYLHAGLPVLARINPGNDLETLIGDEGIGFVVAGDEPVKLSRRAGELLQDRELRSRMGVAGKALVKRAFSPRAAVRQVVTGLAGEKRSFLRCRC